MTVVMQGREGASFGPLFPVPKVISLEDNKIGGSFKMKTVLPGGSMPSVSDS